MKQLSIPNKKYLEKDKSSIELVRFWIGSNQCHVNLNIGIWADGGKDVEKEIWIWSNVLSDIAQHVANACSQRYGRDEEKTKKEIKKHFDKCMKSRTKGLEGS